MFDTVDEGERVALVAEPWPFEWEPDGSDIDWSLADRPDVDETPLPDALLGRSLAEPPSCRATNSLASLDPQSLSDGQRLDQLLLVEQQIRWLQSAQARILATIEAADQPEQAAGWELAADAVSLTLRISFRAAQSRLKTAHTLVTELPATLDLLAAGRISDSAANVVAETSWQLPPEKVAGFEAAALRHAGSQTPAQFGRAVRRALLAADPDGADRRHEAARRERRVELRPACDGMAELWALLPAVQARALFTRLDAAAGLLPSCDERSHDAQRADLLVDGVLSGIPADAAPKRQGHCPTVQITVGADTLLGLDERAGELAGYGPITARAARRAAADSSGTWRRLLTDPDTGELADASPRCYRPSARLVDYLDARDSRCVHPTCEQPAWRCEVEHEIPFDHDNPDRGGLTTRANTAMMCRRHHNLKTGRRHSYRRRGYGGITWTDHTGRTHTAEPERDWTTSADVADPGTDRPVLTTRLTLPMRQPSSGAGSPRWSMPETMRKALDDRERAPNSAPTTAPKHSDAPPPF